MPPPQQQKTIDRLLAQIATLQTQNATLQASNIALQASVAALTVENANLRLTQLKLIDPADVQASVDAAAAEAAKVVT